MPPNLITSAETDSSGLEARPDLSAHLTRQIFGLIESGKLQAGDRLPSMKELAERFSVATPTIREALRRLQATGVVDIRHGSGIYVRRSEQGAVITNPHYGDLDGDAMMQLLDARLAIEPYLTGKAAELATTDDIASLKGILNEAELLLSGQDSVLHPTNMRFHTRIARLAGNRILSEFLDSLVELYSREQLGILDVVNARTRDHQEHLHIFAAIAAGDVPLASGRMQDHLIGVRDVVARRLSERTPVRT
jgi:GntR family transcriptional regulator, transcriptional repressor for pyruvate dehydrogenase complex